MQIGIEPDPRKHMNNSSSFLPFFKRFDSSIWIVGMANHVLLKMLKNKRLTQRVCGIGKKFIHKKADELPCDDGRGRAGVPMFRI